MANLRPARSRNPGRASWPAADPTSVDRREPAPSLAPRPATRRRRARRRCRRDDEPEVTRRLRAQYAEISQLAGGLAHEIRNPLSTLSLNLDLLAEDFQNAETPRDRRVLQRVERLQHEVQRLHDILENFLRFARVQELKLEPTDLNAIVDELRDFYEPHAATQGDRDPHPASRPTCPRSGSTPTCSSRPS